MKTILPICASFFLAVVVHTNCFAEDAYDPIEPVNRGMFWFNERFDQNIFGPVAHGYDYIMPDEAQVGVTNFFKNLRYPTYLISDLLQFKLQQALEHTGRFVINTTVGILGLVDVAKDVGLEDKQDDFGLAFASYGIPAGPYIVLPLLGPSNVRDTVGLVLDTVTNPVYLFSYTKASGSSKFWVETGATVIKSLQLRVNLDDAIKAGRVGSLDYYTFVQSSYYQYRTGQINGENPSESERLNSKSADVDRDLDEITKGEKSKPKS